MTVVLRLICYFTFCSRPSFLSCRQQSSESLSFLPEDINLLIFTLQTIHLQLVKESFGSLKSSVGVRPISQKVDALTRRQLRITSHFIFPNEK